VRSANNARAKEFGRGEIIGQIPHKICMGALVVNSVESKKKKMRELPRHNDP